MILLIPMLINFFIFITSIIFPMFGQGGGTVYVPLFSLKGFSFYQAVAISQFLIVVSAFSAILVYHKARMVSWKLFLLAEIPTFLGAFVGGFSAHIVPYKIARIIFVCLVFVSGVSMFKDWSGGIASIRWNCGKFTLIIGAIGMFFAGFLAGLLGIGGGVIKVPIMVILLGIPVKLAVGTSGLMVGFTALSGLIGHSLVLPINIRGFWPYVLIVFIGAQIGSRISVKVDKRRYKRLLGLMLILIAVFYYCRL